MGKNIPCDLHNEHMNKLLKGIVANMGPNLTEVTLQRAARSVSTIHTVCENFEKQSGVPFVSSTHSTRSGVHEQKERATYSANTLIINDVLPLYLGINVRHIYLTRISGITW